MLKDKSNAMYVIRIDAKEDRPKYTEILKSNLPFKNNLELFTMAALIGKYVLNEKNSINKTDPYIRVIDNLNSDDMVILKCIAIAEKEDVKVIKDDAEMFKVCEEYARAGIAVLYDWFDNKNVDFETKLSEILLKSFKENEKIQETE